MADRHPPDPDDAALVDRHRPALLVYLQRRTTDPEGGRCRGAGRRSRVAGHGSQVAPAPSSPCPSTRLPPTATPSAPALTRLARNNPPHAHRREQHRRALPLDRLLDSPAPPPPALLPPDPTAAAEAA